ncbi:MAG: hypothetical protein ACK45K_06380 [Burkholderiaceae bacterium]|jgi:ABC-type iron transport system FetAB permease component|nr:hypothetical protein [Oxalobacteraceae bacterium]
MIQFLNIFQLLLYIGLLALAGQGLLYVLTGEKRDSNLFFQLFQILNRPWLGIARLLSPSSIDPRHHGWVAFFVTSVLYIAVTLAKIEHCVNVGVENCR